MPHATATERRSVWRKVVFWTLLYSLVLSPSVTSTSRGRLIAEETPDIEDLSSEPVRGGGGGGRVKGKDDSLVELEKVIEEEEAKELGESTPRSAAKSDPVSIGAEDDITVLDDEPAPSERGSGNGRRSALQNSARQAVRDPAPEEEISIDDDALGMPADEPQSKRTPPRRAAASEDPSLDEMEELADQKPAPRREARRAPDTEEASTATDAVDPELTELPADDFTKQGTKSSRATAADDFAEVPGANPALRNDITNLEFKMDGANSRILVSSRSPLTYREVKNPGMKQVVYYFENTGAAEKLQRAYDTTEFASPVALFTLLQTGNGATPASKLIVQLREDIAPSVIPSDRGLYIDFGPPTKDGEPRLVVGKEDEIVASEENIYSGGQNYTGRLIRRLEIKNSDVQDVLRLIARTSGYNIVVGDDVSGKVGTLSLENIPWDQAFALVLQTKKLGYIRQGNVLRVGTLGGLQTEKSESLANERAKIAVEPLRTVLIPVSYAKANELSQQGRNFLTERGTIDVDVRTNTVIVKDVRKATDRIQKLFSALDTQPPRVSISARFVEMRSTFSRDIGFNSIRFEGDLAGLNLTQNISPGATGSVSNTSISAPDFANLVAIFSMAETENKVKTLANPAVSVVANQAANISQTFSIVRRVTSVTAGGTLTEGLQQVNATLNLSVTPIVAGDGTIFMQIRVTNEIPTLPNGAEGSIQIDTRNVETQVLIENGDTAVVGSIFSNNVTSIKSGIPFLMRVPILGFFVSSDSYLDTRNEVFVFLTAKIMNAEEAFKRSF